ncbi:MAG: hypothetical protein KJ645_11970, partial [Planctomycetes bacterium]|nr:hypothetical protein [Planctomycetota bacterium]
AKELLQIEYDMMKAGQELSIMEDELHRHGLEPGQIQAIKKGKIPTVDAGIWLGALQNNGYWTPLAQEIYSALPDEIRSVAWTVATIAELVAGDLADESFVAWLKQEPKAAERFLEIGGLLQQGHHLEGVKNLWTLGALEPLVQIRAPATAEDWDVRDIRVKPGKYVEAGETLLTLENPRKLFFQAEPTESEVKMVLDAMQSKADNQARPLVSGTAPPLDHLKIQRLFSDDQGKTLALLDAPNLPVHLQEDVQGTVYRTWRLREGQRYELRIPIETLDKAYVLPTEAVVNDGADKVVFLRSGDEFLKIQVQVLYQDHEVAVLPATSNLFPGNPIVIRGAFALSLALRSESGAGGGDPHAGHSH